MGECVSACVRTCESVGTLGRNKQQFRIYDVTQSGKGLMDRQKTKSRAF